MAIVSVKVDKPLISDTNESSAFNQRCFVEFDTPTNIDTKAALSATDGTNTVPTAPFQSGSVWYIITRRATSIEGNIVIVDIGWDLFKGADPQKPAESDFWRPRLEISSQTFEEEIYEDYGSTPKPIVNTAGERLITGIKRPWKIRVYHITYRTSVYPEPTLESIDGAINSASLTLTIQGASKTFAAKTLYCNKADHVLNYDESGDPYWDVSIELWYKASYWLLLVASMGYNELVSGSLKPIVKPGTQTPITSPWPLNLDGTKKASATDVGDPIYFQNMPAVSFGFLATIGSF